METAVIKKFEEMGAKVQVNERKNPHPRFGDFSINIRNGIFQLTKTDKVDLQVVDIDKEDRHLLLLVRLEDIRGRETKQRYLAGHDERDWFTCAIPTVVKTVFEAKEQLKPKELRDLESGGNVKTKNKQKRHRKVKGVGKVHRQGEFMFIPQPDWKPSKGTFILKNEPMRQNGRPHVAAEVIRFGGRNIYTRGRTVLEIDQFKELQKKDPKEASRYRIEVANPTVYARGTIRHPDHKTLDLGELWHKVLVNTEQEATFIRNVLFID
jgi:hypothetical protein